MARYQYIDSQGQTRSIEASSAEDALTRATNIAPNSGVMLEVQASAPTTTTPQTNPVVREGVDLSLVGEVGSMVPAPTTQAPTATTTGTGFVTPELTGIDRLGSDISSLQSEIRTIEDRMANRSVQRQTELEGVGVFDDIRRLNELNAELRAAQDRQIEVPLEQRAALRGRQATTTEFEQATRPELESAALRELTASRASARITDAINTNIREIDSRIQAEAQRDEFIYQQKQDYLNRLESNYSNILTEQQKFALEERKFQYDLLKMNAQMYADLKQDAIKALPKNLFADPNFSASIADMSLEDIYGLSIIYGGSQSFLNMTPAQAYSQLSGEQLRAWEAYQKSNAETKTLLDVEQNKSNAQAEIIKSINNLLNDTEGFSNSVGFGLGNRDISLFGVGRESDKFRAESVQLIRKMGNQALKDLRASGVTPGPITEREWSRFDSMGSLLEQWSINDSNGNPTGRFKVKEDVLRDTLQEMQTTALKLFLIANVGEGAFNDAGYSNASRDSLLLKFQDVQSNPTESLIFQQRQNLNNPSPVSINQNNATTTLLRLSNAIATQESRGNYNAVGPVVTSGAYKGQQALGKYQIMPGNIPSWSREILGYSITPEQFYASPSLQDQLAMGKIYQLLNQYGNPQDVASVWFSGRPLASNVSRDVTGTSVPEYVRSVMTYYNS